MTIDNTHVRGLTHTEDSKYHSLKKYLFLMKKVERLHIRSNNRIRLLHSICYKQTTMKLM